MEGRARSWCIAWHIIGTPACRIILSNGRSGAKRRCDGPGARYYRDIKFYNCDRGESKLDAQQQTVPNCTKCTHYYITHDAHFLHGCRAHKFKSRQLPQYAVIAASDTECLAFAPKAARPSC
jgi:hypothetical protein